MDSKRSRMAATLSLLVTVVGWVGCGGEPEASSPPPTTVAADPGTGSGAGGATGGGAGALTGPEYQGDHSLPGDPVAGEVVYRANCIACHAENGRGNGGLTGADFVGDRRRLTKNNDTLLRSIREGVPNSPPMPAHRDILSDQQMRDALSYVRQHFGASGS
jgi:mono/diheme cytochrome c family protein